MVGSQAQGSKLQPIRVEAQTTEVVSAPALSGVSFPTPTSVGASSPLHEQSTKVSSQAESLLHPVVDASSRAPKRENSFLTSVSVKNTY